MISFDTITINFTMKKSTRSWSGVLPISVALEGNSFSCKHDCSFCTSETVENGAEKTIARSYLSSEGSFLRGNMSDFKSFEQIIRRLLELESMDHYPDKLEIIVLGGTWDCYPLKYRNEFIHDIYYACNIYLHFSKYFDKKFYYKTEQYLNQKPFHNKLPLPEDFFNDIRPRESLENEKHINTNLEGVRVIGIVLETRPDYINVSTMLQKRRLGCTRVQLGIQHTDNDVLLNNNRGHTTEASIKAIRRLKDNCFKIDSHVMPDMAFSTIEKDYEMSKTIFGSPEYQCDYVKIYPCLDLPFTKAREWKKSGIWKPYAETDYQAFVEYLAYTCTLIPPWTRINRIHRDFPKASTKNMELGYQSDTVETNLNQFVQQHLEKTNRKCFDIRSREVKNQIVNDFDSCGLYIRKYRQHEATEFFISLEKKKHGAIDFDDTILLGFARLRILDKDASMSHCIPSLRSVNIARLRELHVYGFISGTSDKTTIQHKGIGRFLLSIAEVLSIQNDCNKIAVISGVGVRNYYRKFGYKLEDHDDGDYMFKKLRKNNCQILKLRCDYTKKTFIFFPNWLPLHFTSKKEYGQNLGIGECYCSVVFKDCYIQYAMYLLIFVVVGIIFNKIFVTR